MSAQNIRHLNEVSRKQILKSALFHLSVILVFTVNAYLFPSDPIEIDSVIRVDIVGLPEKAQKLAPAPEKIEKPMKPAAEPVPETPKPAVKVETKVKKNEDLDRKLEQEKALDRLKALEALNQIEKEVTQKQKSVVAGNEVNAGNALTGIRENQISTYIGTIKEHVKSNWNLPQWMAAARLRAEAVVMIDQRGVVVRRVITKSSGHSGFDDSVLAAIDESSPFPAPPPALAGVFKNRGFTLGFPE